MGWGQGHPCERPAHSVWVGAFLIARTPVTNEEFSRAIAHALGRPSWLRVPPLALRTLLGSELADTALLNGQRVVPARALAAGFRFQFGEVNEAVANALSEA